MAAAAVGCGGAVAGAPRDNDPDHDGIVTSLDRCPAEAEDLDGFADDDGCYDADNDADGVPDERDLCPLEPEDHDRYEDLDGCPDPDNDQDRILDAVDACPNQIEIYNGFEDGDGCPDPGAFNGTPPFTDNIFVLPVVCFAADSAQLAGGIDFDSLARWLRSEPKLERLAIIGHADSGESEPSVLAKTRADAVRAELLARGVAPERLPIFSAGLRPAPAWAAIERAPHKNRSVRFLAMRIDGTDYFRWAGDREVAVHKR